MRRFFPDPVKEEADPFFNSDLTVADTKIPERLSHSFVWAFVFFPRTNIVSKADLLMCPAFLECGTDSDDIFFGWDYIDEHAFAVTPSDPGEIEHTCPASK